VTYEGDEITVSRSNDERQVRSLHGLCRTLISNNVIGVSSGFKRELEVIGIGYRVALKGKDILSLYLGYSHTNDYFLPEGVTVSVEGGKSNKITLESCDKQLLGEVAAQIRKLRTPEPYKGKGIRYSDEVVRKKVGKAVVGR
jgi:large subunit ribosomal protein L6